MGASLSSRLNECRAMNKPRLGDMIAVYDGDRVVAQGIIQGGTLSTVTHEHTSFTINTTYGDGFSISGEPCIHGVDPERVEIVERRWSQKWQKRCYGR